MGFPDKLRQARLAAGLTQQQVADAMGITNSAYCGYETGKRQPDVQKIKQISAILDVSGDDLLETGFGETKKPVLTNEDGLNDEIIQRLCQLTSEELARVDAFVQGLLAAR